ncbi:hypothetical protein BV25DRAFT_835860 [Artomyces pyxidatus]|uniref:Uncharacterized protein n=1 Tax=Artomyces pyxidatus TaxID=48021 RepID=A0ACB8TGP6_9AGAM|nr:hypothetical protein BV25DRAFT_835860 [Artomyces pyxidatus]
MANALRAPSSGLTLALLAFFLLPYASATPLLPAVYLYPRSAIIEKSAENGTIIVIDPTTHVPIPQSAPTDGSGTGFASSPPAIMWVAICFLFGFPLAVAGVRGWRLTTGAVFSIAFGVSSWAAFINSVSTPGIPDLTLTIIVFGFMLGGFLLGLFPFVRIYAITLLGLAGGFAIGVRLPILKENLLFTGTYSLNWIPATLLAVAGGIFVTLKQRAGILVGCASTGTFLLGLGVDLIVNKQSGMSRGLRVLFDRNSSHLADILTKGYHPPASSQIIIGVSLGLIPMLAYMQHLFFPQPFNRNRPESVILMDEESSGTEKTRSSAFGMLQKPFASRFSL